ARSIEHVRNRGILKRFVCHDVTPVARRIADGEKDRLLLAPRFLKGLIAPRMPIDGVAGVLQQIGTALGCETVGHVRSTLQGKGERAKGKGRGKGRRVKGGEEGKG